jgi:hypothetical protein
VSGRIARDESMAVERRNMSATYIVRWHHKLNLPEGALEFDDMELHDEG